MYRWIPWELNVDPFGSAKHTSGITDTCDQHFAIVFCLPDDGAMINQSMLAT
jgi:hypothetical protein